jgi:bifunctional non-homologous end joining protein LigD
MSATRTVDVDGREVTLTNLDKVLWPDLALTKAWLVRYYDDVATVILPHLRGKPVTLHRFPDGVAGSHWYQTRAPAHPPWVHTMVMRPRRTGKVFDVVVIDDRASLLWAANLGGVEIHPYLGCADRIDEPTVAVFDLDPGDGVTIAAVCSVATRLRDVLDGVALESFAKTTGGVGLHVYVPLNTPHSYDATKTFARAVAELLREHDPGGITTVMARRARHGKVFVDWSQNDAGKSTVAPYSLRGYPIPTVSMPVTWDEVARAADGDAGCLPVTPVDAASRLDRFGDLFAPVLTVRQRLPMEDVRQA